MRKNLSCHCLNPPFKCVKTPPLLLCRPRPLLRYLSLLVAHWILGLTGASHQSQRNQRPINTSTSAIQAAPQQPVSTRSSFYHVFTVMLLLMLRVVIDRYISVFLAIEKPTLINHYFRCDFAPLHRFKTSSKPHINYIVQCPKFSSMFLSRRVKTSSSPRPENSMAQSTDSTNSFFNSQCVYAYREG